MPYIAKNSAKQPSESRDDSSPDLVIIEPFINKNKIYLHIIIGLHVKFLEFFVFLRARTVKFTIAELEL